MIITKTSKYIQCPHCLKATNSIDHLDGKEISTRWYCDDCGNQYSFKLSKTGEITELKLTGDRIDKSLVLLKNGDIGLVVEGLVFNGDLSNNNEYFYNEHTCPTNYMKRVKEVFDLKNDDTDPHGIFEYVKTLPWDSNINECNNSELTEKLLREFNNKEEENYEF